MRSDVQLMIESKSTLRASKNHDLLCLPNTWGITDRAVRSHPFRMFSVAYLDEGEKDGKEKKGQAAVQTMFMPSESKSFVVD